SWRRRETWFATDGRGSVQGRVALAVDGRAGAARTQQPDRLVVGETHPDALEVVRGRGGDFALAADELALELARVQGGAAEHRPLAAALAVPGQGGRAGQVADPVPREHDPDPARRPIEAGEIEMPARNRPPEAHRVLERAQRARVHLPASVEDLEVGVEVRVGVHVPYGDPGRRLDATGVGAPVQAPVEG